MSFEWPVPQPALTAFCERHHIIRLAVFGSAMRDDFSPDSDVDVLVEFSAEHVPGLIRIAGIAHDLSALVGRPVDLRTAGDLSRYFRGRVVESAVVKYAA